MPIIPLSANVLSVLLDGLERIRKHDKTACSSNIIEWGVWKESDIKRYINVNCNKAEVVILISSKVVLRIRIITREKGGHYVITKGLINQVYTTILNVYAPSKS